MCGPQPNSSLQLRFTVQYSVLRIKICRFFWRRNEKIWELKIFFPLSSKCPSKVMMTTITIISNDSYIAFYYTVTIKDTLMTNYCRLEA